MEDDGICVKKKGNKLQIGVMLFYERNGVKNTGSIVVSCEFFSYGGLADSACSFDQ